VNHCLTEVDDARGRQVCARSHHELHIATCVSLTASQTDKNNWSTSISSSSPRRRWWRRTARETSGALLEEVLLILKFFPLILVFKVVLTNWNDFF